MWVPTTSYFAHIQDQADDSDILPLVIFPLEQMFGQTQLYVYFCHSDSTILEWRNLLEIL
jgi:hypothetical protein